MILIKDLLVKIKDFTLNISHLEIRNGEYFVILGPSGVGKTVLLHTLMGFIKPVNGTIIVNGVDVSNLPPERRNFALIPQDFALFPHMNVFDNIAYGLRVRKVPEDEIRRRVLRIMSILEIDHLSDRRPDQLSGGEKQRVALARALVINPHVLLLDEPLANLDPRLRIKARSFIKRLHKELCFTAIHVTHNIVEALDLGERIGYMMNGKLIFVASPEEFLRTKYARYYINELKPLLKFIVD